VWSFSYLLSKLDYLLVAHLFLLILFLLLLLVLLSLLVFRRGRKRRQLSSLLFLEYESGEVDGGEGNWKEREKERNEEMRELHLLGEKKKGQENKRKSVERERERG
jgi:cell shape-determining protein MreC